jgi:hypothetical protein
MEQQIKVTSDPQGDWWQFSVLTNEQPAGTTPHWRQHASSGLDYQHPSDAYAAAMRYVDHKDWLNDAVTLK